MSTVPPRSDDFKPQVIACPRTPYVRHHVFGVAGDRQRRLHNSHCLPDAEWLQLVSSSPFPSAIPSAQPGAAVTSTRMPCHPVLDCPDFKKTVAKNVSCLSFFYLNKCHFSISETGQKTKNQPIRASSSRLKRAFQASPSQISSFHSHLQQ